MKLIEIGFLFCELHAPSPHFFRAGVVKYIIKPKATLSYFQYSQVSSNFKFSNVASAFSADAPWLHMLHLDPQKHPRTINPRTFQEPVLCCSLLLEQTTKDLNASRVLEKIWRVSFPKASMEPWLVLFCWISFWTLTLTWWGLLPFFQKFSKRIRLPRKSHRGSLYTFWGCLPLWLPTMWSDLCESGFACLGNLLFFRRVPTWSDLCELFEQHDVFDEESFKLFFLNRFSNIWYLNGCTESFEGSHLLWAVVQHMASSWFFERSVRAIVEKERALWFSSSSSVG